VSVETKDEAMAFIETLRLTISGKVGFKWLSAKLSDLAAFIESMAAENERLNAYVDDVGSRAGYESFAATYTAAAVPGPAAEAGSSAPAEHDSGGPS